MEDFFKNLTPEKILKAAESVGRQATGRIYQLNSLENRVYEIEMEEGSPVVGKFYRAGRWSQECILQEHEFLKDLEQAEIPVIPPLNFGQTEDGLYFAIFPKAQGRAPDELKPEQARQLGRLVARMHAVGKTKQANHRPLLNPENYGLKPLDFLLSGGWIAIEIQSRYEKLAREIIDLITPLFKSVEFHRIHGDCHLGNLLFDSSGTKAFFLDFDDMVQGPAAQDVWLATPDTNGEENILRKVFLEGYEEMHPFDQSTLKLIEPLRALRIINYSAWIARRWDDPFFKKVFTEFRDYKYWAFELENLERISTKIK